LKAQLIGLEDTCERRLRRKNWKYEDSYRRSQTNVL